MKAIINIFFIILNSFNTLFSIFITFYTCIIFPSSSYAEIINVPADMDSIQGGINLASDGDTVLVSEGRYYENINFKGKAIIFASQFIINNDTSQISSGIYFYLIEAEDYGEVKKMVLLK